MLREVAEGVRVHESRFMQSNAVIVHGGAGVLLIDPGIGRDELAGITDDLRELDRRVAVGFSTHPHWDHLLWHADLGAVPRYGTAAGAAVIASRLADESWRSSVAPMIPPDIVERVPLDDLFGRITGLAAGSTRVPWDGPDVRIMEHGAHAPGHAALVIEEHRVLVAGDMLSDVLIPILNFLAEDPVADYLAALQLFDDAADGVEVVIPGHGSVGDQDELRVRIDRDRAYLTALRDGRGSDDPRLQSSAPYGAAMTAVHERQQQSLA